MAEKAHVEDLTEEEQLQILQAAVADQKAGRLLHCSTPEEAHRAFAKFRSAGR